MQAAPHWLASGKSARGKEAAVLALAALVLVAAALARSFEYDEAYTFFLTAGVPRPHWPDAPFLAGTMRGVFHARAGLVAVARALRTTDVHPPLYFWAVDLWRRAFGDSLIVARLLSVCCALVALMGVVRLAVLSGIGVVPAVLLTLGCYGFAYTGVVARGFALAQALALWGFVVAVQGRGRARSAFAAGLLLGSATFCNYLTVFLVGPVLGWMVLERLAPDCVTRQPLRSLVLRADSRAAASGGASQARSAPERRWREAALVALGAGLSVPLDLWFFLAQRGSRVGQFPPFHLIPSLVRLARCFAGAVFGALPLYVPFPFSLAVGALLAALLVLVAAFVVARWRCIPGPRVLFALGALAPAAGLIALGMVFDNTPIELRYLAFATPFCALLLTGAAQTAAYGRVFLGAVGAVQVLSIAGLIFHPSTMQPARRSAAEAARLAGGGVVLVPYGNDGVGVVGPFIAEAPDDLRVLVVPNGTSAEELGLRLAGLDRVVLALLTPDAESKAAVPRIRAALRSLCRAERGGARAVVVFQGCR